MRKCLNVSQQGAASESLTGIDFAVPRSGTKCELRFSSDRDRDLAITPGSVLKEDNTVNFPVVDFFTKELEQRDLPFKLSVVHEMPPDSILSKQNMKA